MKQVESHSEKELARWLSGFALLIYTMGVVAGFFLNRHLPILFIVAEVVILILLGCLAAYATNQGAMWSNGLIGEIKISAILDQLPKPYYVFENIVCAPGRGDIDSIVVGPTGVWAIEVKHVAKEIKYSQGQLTRNGRLFWKDPLKQTFAEAACLAAMLQTKGCKIEGVKPVLVFSARYAKVQLGKEHYQGVQVISHRWLRDLIENESVSSKLSETEINQIVEVIKNRRS
jgi:hypothetical protein